MPFLNSLKLSITSPRQPITPLQCKRGRLLEQIDLQIQAVEVELRDEAFVQEVRRWIRDDETGEKELKVIQKPVLHWWWKNDAGHLMLSVRLGNRILELADGKLSIEVGDMQKLPDILQTLKKTIAAGELDKQLEKAISKTPRLKKGKPATVTSRLLKNSFA